MKHDLSSYLVDRGADESRVVTWYHRQFKEAAVERYLSDKEETVGTDYTESTLGCCFNSISNYF